jgi:hypothetical protein
MTGESLSAAAVWVVAIVLLVLAVTRKRSRGRRTSGVGSAAVGAVYGFLNEDKRNAIEVIVEDRAGARDPEDRDGNLPELERPKR